jgi:hypothetical protein
MAGLGIHGWLTRFSALHRWNVCLMASMMGNGGQLGLSDLGLAAAKGATVNAVVGEETLRRFGAG